MNAIDVLRDEYPGDLAWKRFVEVFRPAWESFKDRDDCAQEIGDEEIAIVLTASMGGHAMTWFRRPCGPLGSRSPSDVLLSENRGKNIVRTLLMRMPR